MNAVLHPSRWQLWIDRGGTFTDIVLDVRGRLHSTKVLTSYTAPEQAILDGIAQYPTVDHNKSKMVGPMVAVLAMSRTFLDKNRDAAQKLVDSYYSVMQNFRNDRPRWAAIFAEKSGLPPNVAAESR